MTPGDEEVENSEKMVHCEFCDFAAKNQRNATTYKSQA